MDPYLAGQTLGSLFGAKDRAYSAEMDRQQKLEAAKAEARYKRAQAVLAEGNVSQRGVMNDPALVGRFLAGDTDARNEYLTAATLANPNVDIKTLGEGLQVLYRQAARDKAVLGDADNPNAELFGVANGPVETTKISDGVAYSPLGSSSQTVNVTPLGEAAIGQRRASAAASYASADNSRASAARTRQAMSLDRADVLGGGGGKPASKAPSGYRWAANGTLEAIPGGPADKPLGSGATEDERKAAGWLGQATRALSNMEQALYKKDDKGAFLLDARGQRIPTGADTPGFIETYSWSPELGNRSMSPDRQRYSNAASSLSEALLRAATGAGVNESEAKQKIAELTPQRGDSEEVKKQKLAGAAGYIDDLRARAGRALPAAPRTLGDAPSGGIRKRYNPATGRVE
ncbi:hypothetical protein [Stenotrophomonas muris]|uniref:hypothetical protein n=1 Tax=Stenotrophomonas muris TaxID=2963283 RepID=UPI0039C6BE22